MRFGWNSIDDESVGDADPHHIGRQAGQESIIETGTEAKPTTMSIEGQSRYTDSGNVAVGDDRSVGHRLGISETMYLARSSHRMHRQDSPLVGGSSQCEVPSKTSLEQRCKIRLTGHRVEQHDPPRPEANDEVSKSTADPIRVDLEAHSIGLCSLTQIRLLSPDRTVNHRATLGPSLLRRGSVEVQENHKNLDVA